MKVVSRFCWRAPPDAYEQQIKNSRRIKNIH